MHVADGLALCRQTVLHQQNSLSQIWLDRSYWCRPEQTLPGVVITLHISIDKAVGIYLQYKVKDGHETNPWLVDALTQHIAMLTVPIGQGLKGWTKCSNLPLCGDFGMVTCCIVEQATWSVMSTAQAPVGGSRTCVQMAQALSTWDWSCKITFDLELGIVGLFKLVGSESMLGSFNLMGDDHREDFNFEGNLSNN